MQTFPKSKEATILSKKNSSRPVEYGDIHLDDVTVLWYDDKGRLNIQFTENVVYHYSGTKSETIAGSSFEHIKGNKTELTNKQHHVNPTGKVLFNKLTKDVKPGDIGEVYDVMTRRQKLYDAERQYLNRREFYIRAAYNNMTNNRPKKRGCGCA